jgi:nucleoside-diphosphate-sugar epimerase
MQILTPRNFAQKLILPERYSSLRHKKILVTGAGGFIGGALLRRLANYDLDAIGTVLNNDEADALQAQGHQTCLLDLTSDDSWDDILKHVHIVYNIAAMFQEVEFGRDVYNKANHLGALKLAKTAEHMGVERFIHCSTVGVLGDVKENPATETTAYNPMDIYHETKLAGELAILDWAKTLPEDGMVVTVNRPAMVYGPGDLRMLKLFKTILAGKFMMIGSGETLAHLGYIEDQVDSFLLQAVVPREKIHLEVFNIASGEPITLNTLAAFIAEAGGVKLSRIKIPLAPVWFASYLCELICKPFGVKPPLFRRRVGFFTHNRAFDISKAKNLLGYCPRWNERDGIAKTIEWYYLENLL